ncbi:MAG: insulinase family protein [Planctomycetes bacterium]|nr:insulinase family protein [Planctomycetota bacterium]
MVRRASAKALLLLVALAGGGAAARAQAQADPPPELVAFTTPDGTRFLLLPAPGMPLLHWAIATLADDPPALPGLSMAVMLAAQGGTWRTGSHEPAREREALDRLDQHYHAWLANPADAEAGAALLRWQAVAAELGDPEAHGRVMASLPVYRPEVLDRAPVCLVVASTVPEALGDLAERVRERREENALRELQARWIETVVQRADRQRRDGRTALHAEVLALAMPDHPLARDLAPPRVGAPRRAEAIATWQAMQRPERTVHVLHGGFTADSARAVLERCFATTSLPPAAVPPPVSARPIANLRRSVVTGQRLPTAAIAFVLPPNTDRTTLEVAGRWLGGGADSRLGQELPRRGRPRARVSCRAPWPPTVDGASLLLLEVEDPDGIDGLAMLALQVAHEATAAAPPAAALATALAGVQRDWLAAIADPRQLAAATAEAALLWPRQAPRLRLPERIDAAAVQRLLAQVLANPPVVVEGTP